MEGMAIATQELCRLIHVHAHLRGVWLRPTCVMLQNVLLLEPEQPIKVS